MGSLTFSTAHLIYVLFGKNTGWAFMLIWSQDIQKIGIWFLLPAFVVVSIILPVTGPPGALTEIFALDVISDWRQSIKNCEEMWKQGVEAIPCFHVGEPIHVLKDIARDYPKIALGGAVGFRTKDKWAEQCFARIWPKKVHGFGFGAEKSIMLLPWHSVDATNWEIGPCKFGRWQSMGGQYVNWRGSKQNLRAEVEWYLDLEKKARLKWAGAMKQLEEK